MTENGLTPARITRPEILTLILLAVLYMVPVVACWNQGYLDFGDGNYMYISWRLSQGAVLYRDILAPQPPLHLYLGAAIAWIGDRLFPHPLWAFRTFSLLLHLATMVLVFATARLVHARSGGRRTSIPLVAAAIYLIQPIGFWWTLGYQSQPLLIFLLLIMFYGIVKNTRSATVMAGVAGGLALLTNMTTAPYVLFTMGWMMLRRFHRGLLFTVIAIIPPLIVIPAMQMYTGAYLSNVFENQAGAFPRADVLATGGETIAGYMLRKVRVEGGDVLRLEGVWITLGIIGMILYSAKRKTPSAKEFILYFAFFSLCCILYVTKGGTVDYVFSVAEPYVALFAGIPLLWVAFFLKRSWGSGPNLKNFTPIIAPMLGCILAIAVAWPGIYFCYETLRQRTYELTEPETLRIVSWIKQRTKPDDLIIAPPHFAFLAKRRILEDYSEHFLWRIKYMNERLDGQEGRGVKTVERMSDALEQKKVPFLVLDLNQTGTLPEIKSAVEANYRPLFKEPLQTLNTPLQFYEPKP